MSSIEVPKEDSSKKNRDIRPVVCRNGAGCQYKSKCKFSHIFMDDVQKKSFAEEVVKILELSSGRTTNFYKIKACSFGHVKQEDAVCKADSCNYYHFVSKTHTNREQFLHSWYKMIAAVCSAGYGVKCYKFSECDNKSCIFAHNINDLFIGYLVMEIIGLTEEISDDKDIRTQYIFGGSALKHAKEYLGKFSSAVKVPEVTESTEEKAPEQASAIEVSPQAILPNPFLNCHPTVFHIPVDIPLVERLMIINNLLYIRIGSVEEFRYSCGFDPRDANFNQRMNMDGIQTVNGSLYALICCAPIGFILMNNRPSAYTGFPPAVTEEKQESEKQQ